MDTETNREPREAKDTPKEIYATLDAIPVSEAADRLIKTLSQEITDHELQKGRKNQRGDKMLARFEGVLGSFIADLVRAEGDRRAKGWVFRSMKNSDFVGTDIAYADIKAVVNALEGLRYIERIKTPRKGVKSPFPTEGIGATDGFALTESKASKFKATEALIGKISEEEINPDTLGMHFKWPLKESIVLRTGKRPDEEKGIKIEFKTDPKYTHLRADAEVLAADMDRLNAFISEFPITGGTCLGLYRTFNEGNMEDFHWNKGGRIVAMGNYQGKGEVLRLQMTIGGEEVSEVDIKGCLLTVLHGVANKPFEPGDDPYAVEGLRSSPLENEDLKRWAVKKAMNVSFGLGRPLKAWDKKSPKEFQEKTGRSLHSYYPATKVYEALAAKHPILREWGKLPYTWADLFFRESTAMVKAMMTLMDEYHVPSLPIHDSLLVRRKDVEVTLEVVKASFASVVGVEPLLTVDP